MVLGESGERLAMNARALGDHAKRLMAKYCFDEDSVHAASEETFREVKV